MKKTLLILTILSLFFHPAIASSECVTIGANDTWSILDLQTFAIFRADMVTGIIKVPFCTLKLVSQVNISKDVICSGDIIIVDSQRCETTRIVDLTR